jgi:hypothetical protein
MSDQASSGRPLPVSSLLKCLVVANAGADLEEIQFPLTLISGNTLLAPAGD